MGTAVASRAAPTLRLVRVRWSAWPASAARDLRAPGVGVADERGARAVGHEPSGAVDDQHAAAHRGGGGGHQAAQLGAAPGREQVGGRGGDDVGLRPRLRADLRVHALGAR